MHINIYPWSVRSACTSPRSPTPSPAGRTSSQVYMFSFFSFFYGFFVFVSFVLIEGRVADLQGWGVILRVGG